MRLGTSFLVAFASIVSIASASGQDMSQCGEAPSAMVLKEISESTRVELEGAAKVVSKLVGKEELVGKVHTERRKIYQTTEASEALRNDRYWMYVACVLILQDKGANLQAKTTALKNLRSPVPSAGPVQKPKAASLTGFLTTVGPRTTFERARELLGAPAERLTVKFPQPTDDEPKPDQKTYLVEKYTGDFVDVYVVGAQPIRAVALYLKPNKRIPKGAVPIPSMANEFNKPSVSDTLGGIQLAHLKTWCSGNTSIPDAKYTFALTPLCAGGTPSKGHSFVFGFFASDAVNGCGDMSPMAVADEPFGNIKCRRFWGAKPHFALTYFGSKADEALPLAEALIEEVFFPSNDDDEENG
jgi:hypothetical protein